MHKRGAFSSSKIPRVGHCQLPQWHTEGAITPDFGYGESLTRRQGMSAALLTGQADALTPQALPLEAMRLIFGAPREGGNGNTRTQTAAHG